MKRTLLLLGLGCLAVGVSLGSTINAPSSSDTVALFTGYDGGKEKEINLAGSVAFLNAGGAGNDGCVFTTIGTGNSADSVCQGGTFTITLTPPNSETGSATWSITNTNTSAVAITSLTINLQPGNSIFHPCGTPGTGTIVSGNCNNSGGSVSSVSGGLGIVADVYYKNLATDLVTSGPQPYSPLFYEVQFTWASGVFMPNATAFTFGANSDFFVAPEPATYGMVGLALAGLGALRFRRRGASKS